MADTPKVAAGLRSALALPLLTVWLGTGCGEPPPMPLSTAADVPTEQTEPDAPLPEVAVAAGERELWWNDGPGREAIVARERGERARAVAALDSILAGEASDHERAGAELLLGVLSLELDRPDQAAQHFARAREFEALAPVAQALKLMQAKALLREKKADEALSLVVDLEPSAAVGPEVLLVRAQAVSRTGDSKSAVALYRRFLAESKAQAGGSSARRQARLRLADLLAKSDAKADQREAMEQYWRVLEAAPLSEYGDEAANGLEQLQAKGIAPSKSERAKRATALELAKARDELASRKYAQVVTRAKRMLAGKKLDKKQRCEMHYLHGSAVFKQRKRPAARPIFEAASKACKQAGVVDLEVKSRYQAARGSYAVGDYTKAAKSFERVAGDHPGHSYADDAWILAGESWESASKPDAARNAYRQSPKRHPDGDMAGEARRRLLVMAFANKDHEEALEIADDGIHSGKVFGEGLAKLYYFRGRALEKLGKPGDAQATYLEVVARQPLSYPGLMALSRLRDLGESAHAAGLDLVAGAAADSAADSAMLELPGDLDGEAANRIRIWASLGVADQASRELEAAGVTGWPAVAVFDQAGMWSHAQRKLANLGGKWRAEGPTPALEKQWHLAHPTPYQDLIEPGEQAHGVPPLLTFAIMQTESRFDPGVTSWAGAQGLVQLMPNTAKGVAKGASIELTGRNLHEPALNLDLGMRLLGQLSQRFGGSDAAVALAAPSYNAGAGAVDGWLAERGEWDLDLFIEAIPYKETRNYTQKVLGRWLAYRWLYGPGAPKDKVPYLPLQIPGRTQGSDQG